MRYRWRGKEFLIEDHENITNILELKDWISHDTGIPTDRIKLLGLRSKNGVPSSGKQIEDDTLLSECVMTGDAFIVLGTPSEEQLQCDNHDHRSCYGYNSKACQERAADYWRSSNVMKVFNSRLKRLRLQWMRTPQPGKKLLVLDIDHTIYDCTNMLKESLHDSCRIRPHLSTMFSSLKEYYDYCLWSQTAWQWIETKCSLIGIYESCQSYPLFILDRSNMFSVGKSSNDQAVEPAAGEIVEVVRRNVKCLRLIWDSCPELYSEKNTLHIDDLHKNFGLNPKNGILVSPYRKANYDTDTELLKLTQYLLRVAKLDDVTTMDHSTWKNT